MFTNEFRGFLPENVLDKVRDLVNRKSAFGLKDVNVSLPDAAEWPLRKRNEIRPPHRRESESLTER